MWWVLSSSITGDFFLYNTYAVIWYTHIINVTQRKPTWWTIRSSVHLLPLHVLLKASMKNTGISSLTTWHILNFPYAPEQISLCSFQVLLFSLSHHNPLVLPLGIFNRANSQWCDAWNLVLTLKNPTIYNLAFLSWKFWIFCCGDLQDSNLMCSSKLSKIFFYTM